MENILIVDGTNLFCRTWHGENVKNLDKNLAIEQTSYFALKRLGAIQNEFCADKTIILFDTKSSANKRRRLYPDYKASRKLMVEPWVQNMKEGSSLFRQILEYYDNNLEIRWDDTREADDLVDETKSTKETSRNILVSADLDWCKSIDSNTWLYNYTCVLKEDSLIHKQVIFKPHQITLYKALFGDSSDNIKAVIPRLKTSIKQEIMEKCKDLEYFIKNIETLFIYYKDYLEQFVLVQQIYETDKDKTNLQIKRGVKDEESLDMLMASWGLRNILKPYDKTRDVRNLLKL